MDVCTCGGTLWQPVVTPANQQTLNAGGSCDRTSKPMTTTWYAATCTPYWAVFFSPVFLQPTCRAVRVTGYPTTSLSLCGVCCLLLLTAVRVTISRLWYDRLFRSVQRINACAKNLCAVEALELWKAWHKGQWRSAVCNIVPRARGIN